MTSSPHHPNPRYDLSSPPPESWLPARKFALAVVGPIERFVHVEAASGIVLLAAAVVALLWANSPFQESYEALWHTPFALKLGHLEFERSLHFWINDFLMAIFFFVVGLEIKREFVEGALSDVQRATLPVVAAIGGMVVPALLFTAFNIGSPGQAGWGVPMATDIAFAVGILTLLGNRVPAALRVLLLAIAIIDDLGAILVIAFFYSGGLDYQAIAVVGLGLAGILGLNSIGARPGFIWLIPPLVLWAGVYRLGVHPTIAGVIVGLLTPVRSWFGRDRFLQVARQALDEFQARAGTDDHDDHHLVQPLNLLAQARREAISPAKRLETALHPWVAFGIMPVFALANAGVNLTALDLTGAGVTSALIGIVAGLAIGKPLGIVGLSWLSVRMGMCRLPPGVNWAGVLVLGLASGIGFTMAIFIAELAYADPGFLGAAKLGVLIATAGASVLAYGLGWFVLGAQGKDIEAITESDLESSSQYWTKS